MDGMWMGEVLSDPEVSSGWHHYGEYTTYGYVSAGRLRIRVVPDVGSSFLIHDIFANRFQRRGSNY